MGQLSFAADIRPLFTARDIDSMKKFGGFDLANLDRPPVIQTTTDFPIASPELGMFAYSTVGAGVYGGTVGAASDERRLVDIILRCVVLPLIRPSYARSAAVRHDRSARGRHRSPARRMSFVSARRAGIPSSSIRQPTTRTCTTRRTTGVPAPTRSPITKRR